MRKVCGEKLRDIFVWDKNNAEMQRSSPIQLTDDGFRWAESSFFFSAKAKEIFRDVCFVCFKISRVCVSLSFSLSFSLSLSLSMIF